MGNTATIGMELAVEDKGTIKVKKFADSTKKGITKLGHTVSRKLGGAFTNVGKLAGGALSTISRHIFSLKGAIIGLGLGYLAKTALDTASGFEKMQLSLETITKGRGEEWFRKLNEWALKMPVNTEKAIQSFIMMRAMGLDPTIKQMTALVDTMGALGGNSDMIEGLARALGQMHTKGKVSAEELMQLAERGVPVFEILKEKFGEVDTASLDAGKAIEAIFEGLEERFGGQAEKMLSTWAGMTESLKSYWKEFVRLVMESEVMDWIKKEVGSIIKTIDQMYKDGTLKKWAEETGKAIKEGFEVGIETVKTFWGWIKTAYEGIKTIQGTLAETWSKIEKTRADIQKKINVDILGSKKEGQVAYVKPGEETRYTTLERHARIEGGYAKAARWADISEQIARESYEGLARLNRIGAAADRLSGGGARPAAEAPKEIPRGYTQYGPSGQVGGGTQFGDVKIYLSESGGGTVSGEEQARQIFGELQRLAARGVN